MNIFARELAALLGQHEKKLASLYGLRSDTYYISPYKVSRLMRSLNEDITATLNPEELDLLAAWLGVASEGEEFQRLRAALVAEGVRYLLSGRINLTKASEVAELTFLVLLGQEPKEYRTLIEEILKNVRGGIPPAETKEAGAAMQGEDPLELAAKMLEQGTLWLDLAEMTSDESMRLGYHTQARTLLERAHTLANNIKMEKEGQSQRDELLNVIQMALTSAGKHQP